MNEQKRPPARPGEGYTYRAGAAGAPPAGDVRKHSSKKRRRRARRAVRRALVFVLLIVVILGLAWVITGWIEGREGLLPAPDDTPAAPVAAPGAQSLPEGMREPLASLPRVERASWNFIGPAQQDAEAMQLVATDSRMIARPENGRVDMQYFDTVTFVGDSLTIGLQSWGTIPNAKYVAYVGASPKAIYDGSLQTRPDGTQEIPMDALVASQPDNVYVLLGTNAMVNIADDEVLLAYYSEMLDAMRAALHPEVNFYIQSITPVLPGFEHRFDNARMAALNNALAKMAWEKDMYYLDLHEALAAEDGYMRRDYGVTSDGFHMQPSGYAAWLEYLVTHTAYNRRHAHLYLEGSHYYEQSPPAV